MNSIVVYIETGNRRTFAAAIDWPGWCRGGRDEASALQALVDYGPRYAQVLQGSGIQFHPPADESVLLVAERLRGDATTDFGAPGIVPEGDREPMGTMERERSRELLLACWQAFDRAVERAATRELRTGPRGGGRDLAKIIDHVLAADQGYLIRLAWRRKREGGEGPLEELDRTRQAILEALVAAARGDLPEQGPRGGAIWPARYFVRRVAWHVLDHAWEIEDRMI